MTALVERLRAAGCVFAEEEAGALEAAARDGVELEAWALRRIAGEPLEQVLGVVEFGGVTVRLRPGVFVPRQRTGLVVAAVLEHLPAGATVVDVCCGSGAIGLAVAAARSDVSVVATDLDPVAVDCARANLGARHIVVQGDLLAAVPAGLRGRVSAVVACPPYVPSESVRLMPPEARDHEPLAALDGGSDGLDIVRRLVRETPAWLAADGVLVAEVGEPQTGAVAALMTAAGLTPEVRRDEAAGAVVVTGRARAGAGLNRPLAPQ